MKQAPPHGEHPNPEQQRHLRRNVSAFLTDFGSFGTALGFINPTTVLPVLMRQLTSSAPLVGLMTTVWAGAWLLPQLPAGGWLLDKPRKKPILLWAAGLGRPALLLLAVWFIVASPSNSTALLVALFGAVIIFRTTDAVTAVAWFDVLSKAMPTQTRGRVLGVGQMLAGLGSLGAAVVVRWALTPLGPAFPHNFALLFALAFGGTALSWFALTALVELRESAENGTPQQMSAIAHARHVVRSDRAFRLVTMVRLLAGLTGLALPFYVVHATRELGLPASFVGLAVGVQNIIAVLGSITLGALAERAGTMRVIQVSALASAIAPLTALLLHILRPAGGSYTSLISAGYVLVFALLSAIDCSILLGYLNYVMEIAPSGERAAYVGLTNTISGLLVVLPVIGGVLLQATSYPVLFATAASGAVLGLLLSLRLPSQETK